MLVITRNRGEKIVINDNIVITFLGLRHADQARIGIEAPPEIRVDRLEIYESRRAVVECPACRGYGHFDSRDNPTMDRSGRKCWNCRGEGKTIARP